MENDQWQCTWNPVFDGQASYSIGTVEIDPNNSNVIWVGTGKNVSGRHVAWGSSILVKTEAKLEEYGAVC